MAEFILNKLVRDGVLDQMIADGQTPVFKILEGKELIRAQLHKIKEEADEALAACDDPNKQQKEVGDMLRVIEPLALALGHTLSVDLNNNDGKGGFAKRIFIERVHVPEKSKWAVYYRREPLRFPEVGVDRLNNLRVPSLESGIYRHYKGGMYQVLGVACHSETLEFYVVYKPLNPHKGKPDIWVRPYSMFVESVTYKGATQPRFTKAVQV
jgi:predicted house-cleaning noncanonical NTP pyrophosphatase (MazG superfamily)